MIITRLGSSDDFNAVEITIEPPPAGAPTTGAAYRAVIRTDEGYENRVDFSVDLPELGDLEDDAEEYGKVLGQALFAGTALGPDYGKALAIAQDGHKGLHVRLAVEPPEMQALHWERIYQPSGKEWYPLASSAETPLSRWTASTRWGSPQPVMEREPSMLVVISSPSNLSQPGGSPPRSYELDPISADERERLHKNLDALSDIHKTYLESGTAAPPTLENIRQELGRGYQFVHFLCHGAATPNGTVLYLEKADGTVDPTDAGRLVETFQSLSAVPALCFLAACESAARDGHAAFLPLGPALVKEGGVQAAVAMSDKVGLDTAQVFASQFYSRLLVHGLVDKAVNEARALVRDRWDWGVPVLFSRIEDNRLLDFPIDGDYRDELRRSGRASHAARAALKVARDQGESLQNIQNIEDLILELDKTQKFLAGVAGDFGDTGEDTETFPASFRKFSRDFKRMYRGQTWMEEKISCHRLEELGELILKDMGPRLPPELYHSLSDQLGALYKWDGNFIAFLGSFMEKANQTVDAIQKELRQGNVEAAIEKKINFEEQLERMLNKGKKFLDGMLEATHGARKA